MCIQNDNGDEKFIQNDKNLVGRKKYSLVSLYFLRMIWSTLDKWKANKRLSNDFKHDKMCYWMIVSDNMINWYENSILVLVLEFFTLYCFTHPVCDILFSLRLYYILCYFLFSSSFGCKSSLIILTHHMLLIFYFMTAVFSSLDGFKRNKEWINDSVKAHLHTTILIVCWLSINTIFALK